MTNGSKIFCFGLGYSGLQFLQRQRTAGFAVSGTTRSTEKQQLLSRFHVESHLFSENRPLTGEALAGVTHLLISIPPAEEGDIVLKHHLEHLKSLPKLQWVGYLSTTGVYGDHQGAWVDETIPVNPPDARTKRRVEAEKAWLTSGLPVHIFRLSGIYGPGRCVIEDIRDGTAKRICKEGQVFSRIHVDDIANCLAASLSNAVPGGIYNVCDDEPAPSHDVVTYACELLKVTPPPLVPFEKAELSEMARSFYASNRRVSNKKMKEKLGVILRYPTYREGLKAIANQVVFR